MSATPDPALEAEKDFATLLLATAKTPRERREAWNLICAIDEKIDEQKDLERGRGGERPR